MKYDYFYFEQSKWDTVATSQYQRRLSGNQAVPAVLCANKSDLAGERTVTHAEAVACANLFKIPVIETSAKTAQNIHEAFVTLVRMVGRPRKAEKGGLLNYSFAIVGAGGVGKSAICVQFTMGQFVEQYVRR